MSKPNITAHHPDLRFLQILLISVFSVYSLRLFISPSPSFIWVILFSLIFFCFYRIHLDKKKKNILIASAILGILYSLMSFLSYQLKLNGVVFFDLRTMLSSIGLSFFFFYVLTGICSYNIVHSNNPMKTPLTNKCALKTITLLSFFLLVCWLPYFVACFPGNLNSDALGEIRQQLGLSPLSNHHPVIHQLMVKICLILGSISGNIKTGVVIYTILQMIITAIILSYAILFMYRHNVSRFQLIFSFLFYAFYTINGFYAVTMYKDVPFSGITLLLMIAMINELQGINTSRSLKKRIISLFILVILSFFFCTVRNNGYYAFIIGFILIILFNHKNIKRLIIIFAVTLLLVNSYYYTLFNIVGAQKSSSGEMLSLPLQMFARVVKEEGVEENSEDFLILQEVIPDYDILADSYIPDNSDPIKDSRVFRSDIFDANPSRYLKSWFRIGKEHTRTYMDAFFLHTQGFWDPNRNYSSINAFIYENEFDISHNDSTEPLRVFLINLHTYLSSNSLFSPLYSIGLIVILFLFSFTLLLVKKQSQIASPIFILAALWATSAAAPVCLYQYVYSLTITLPLFLCLSLSEQTRQK